MSKITKLGLGIVAFDDVTHLKNICAEVRDLCDVIVVCLQHTSYFGHPIPDGVASYIASLRREGYINDIIWFDGNDYGDDPAAPRLTETDKRNAILDKLQYHYNCSHSIIIDSDEFYSHDEFVTGMKDVEDNDLDVSYCQYINYYRDYRHVMVWPYKAYVPFVSDSSYRFDFNNGSFDKPSDPTRRYRIDEAGKRIGVLPFDHIKMHHLSWIRKDICSKIDNWSAKRYFDNIEGLRERIIERYNNYQDGLNAIIMFGSPDNEVIVNVLPKQYINPKFSMLD